MKKVFLFLVATMGLFVASCGNDTPEAASIILSQSNIDAWYEAGTYSVDIKTNCAWEATTDREWLTIKNSTGTKGFDCLIFSLSKNDSSKERTATIFIEAKGYYGVLETITVTQSILLDDYFKITYTSTNNDIVAPYDATVFGANIVSNTYENGVGTILFDVPVTKVGECAFCECTTLKSITLPNSISELGGWAFDGCIYMEQATISNRLKTIGDAAFSSCSKLSNITIPQSVNHLGESVFYGCSGMEAYYGKFASEDNRCLIIDNVLRHFAPKGLTEYVIPDGITTIAFAAFYESTKLQSVTIPTSVKSIEDWAFYYCENLKSVYCRPTTPPALGEGVFDNYDGGVDKPIGCKIYVAEKSVDSYKEAANWKRYKSYIYGDGRF